jgi:hypothetical protein
MYNNIKLHTPTKQSRCPNKQPLFLHDIRPKHSKGILQCLGGLVQYDVFSLPLEDQQEYTFWGELTRAAKRQRIYFSTASTTTSILPIPSQLNLVICVSILHY